MGLFGIYQVVHQLYVQQPSVHFHPEAAQPFPTFLHAVAGLCDVAVLKQFTELFRTAGRHHNAPAGVFPGSIAGICPGAVAAPLFPRASGGNKHRIPILKHGNHPRRLPGRDDGGHAAFFKPEGRSGRSPAVIIRRSLAEPALQGAELIEVEQFKDTLPVMAVNGHAGGRESAHVDVSLDCHEETAQLYMVAGGLEERPLLRGQLVQIVINPLHGAVEAQQFLRADLPHALHTGNIVGGVPADCQVVNHLHRLVHAVFLTDFCLVEQFAVRTGLPRPELEDMVGDKLSVVFVRCHHIDRKSLALSLFRH